MRTGPSPLLARRGGCASKKKVRSIRSGADGVVVQVQKVFVLTLNHHPVRSIKGSFAIFLLMSRPPLLARRGDVAQVHLMEETMTKLDRIQSRVTCYTAKNVDTDQIIPARFLKRIDKAGFGDHLFADLKPAEIYQRSRTPVSDRS